MSTGPQGPPGPRGFTGATGPEGEEGRQGPRGNDGERGRRGETGEQKLEPPRDTISDTRAGPRGDVGDRGVRGVRGDPGERGECGERGVAGERGEPGRDMRRDMASAGQPGVSPTDIVASPLGRAGSADVPDIRSRLVSTYGYITFADITALSPDRLLQFDAGLMAFVRQRLAPTPVGGYTHAGMLQELKTFLASFGVYFSLTDSAPYVKRGRDEGVPLGLRVGAFMAHHITQTVENDNHRTFMCWQIVSDLLAFRGLETIV